MNTNELSTKAKAARAAYAKKWRKNNPDKTKIYAARYWERKAEEIQNEDL